ncbi:MAG TPA: helix-turn-helix transcriptional regulator [Spirochaetia bacterium]|nr:helix-turn-helix transcriptional regulator [Spirochaetales bacterium]HRY79670.1 helix-turn-helix transcriptional regulator [Spirochaetia bacterium]
MASAINELCNRTNGSSAETRRPFLPSAFLTCSLLFGWTLAYFYQSSPWIILTGPDGGADSARLFYFGGFLIGMFAGLSFMRRFNVKAMVSGCAAAALAAILVLRFIPPARAGGCGFGLFGILAGTSFGAMFHFWVYAFPGLPRVSSIAAVHLGGGAVSLAVLWAGERFGTPGAAAMDLAVPLVALWAALRVDMSRVEDPGSGPPLTFPGRLMGIVIVLLLLVYFATFLPEGLLSVTGGSAWTTPSPGVRVLVSSAVYLLFLRKGSGIHILLLLYSMILCQLIGYGLIILHAGTSAGSLVLVVGEALGNLFLFKLTFDIFHKHRGRPLIVILFTGAVVLGTSVGMLIGWVLELSGRRDTASFVGMMVVFYSTALALLPPLLRVLEEELSLRSLTRIGPPGSRADAPSSPEYEEEGHVAILDPAYIREPMGRKIRRINERFDPPYRLTEREIEIAALLAGRLDYGSIARRLDISVNTLKTHAKSVYRKFDVPGRKGLIELCLEPDRRSAAEERAAEA